MKKLINSHVGMSKMLKVQLSQLILTLHRLIILIKLKLLKF